VDPSLSKDRKLAGVTDIALSYTFFRAPEPDELAARQEPRR
jgi:cytochrome c oxidase assembly protein Cox11